MSSYIGRHAELYDIFYAEKPYGEEAAFVHQCLQQYSIGKTNRLLELACGTGEHALALEKFGYEIVAVDYSEDMLNCAQRKALETSSTVNFRWQDMRNLNLSEEAFDAVVCLFDSIGYVATNAALNQVLQGINHHLRPDGLLIFEFWHAAAMLHDYEPVRIRRWFIPEGEILRISETTLQLPQQLANVTYSIYELCHDGTYSSFKETQVNRYFLLQEMANLLTFSGFTPLNWFSGFRDDENISQETWHIVGVARKS